MVKGRARVRDVTGSEGIDLPRSIEMVRNGYNLAAGRYAADRDLFENEPHLDRFTKLLPRSASVLDVGCGRPRRL